MEQVSKDEKPLYHVAFKERKVKLEEFLSHSLLFFFRPERLRMFTIEIHVLENSSKLKLCFGGKSFLICWQERQINWHKKGENLFVTRDKDCCCWISRGDEKLSFKYSSRADFVFLRKSASNLIGFIYGTLSEKIYFFNIVRCAFMNETKKSTQRRVMRYWFRLSKEWKWRKKKYQ